MRKNIRYGQYYEDTIAFSRAVRIGDRIWISGTAPISDDGTVFSPGDAYAQSIRCFQLIEKAVNDAGAGRKDIVRTRVFMRDIALWEEVARAHGVFFEGINPASTFLSVSSFINHEWLVEIEAEAFVSE